MYGTRPPGHKLERDVIALRFNEVRSPAMSPVLVTTNVGRFHFIIIFIKGVEEL